MDSVTYRLGSMPLTKVGRLLLIVFLVLTGLSTTCIEQVHAPLPAPPITIHEGDLVLSGNETYTIDWEWFIQKGNIIIADNATLRIKDSKLQLGEESDDELCSGTSEHYRFNVSGTGRLIAENSTILQEYGVMINLYNYSQAVLRGSELTWKLEIDDTKVYTSGLSAHDHSTIECHGSSVGILMVDDDASCTAYGTLLGFFSPRSNAHSTIVNSHVVDLWSYVENGEVVYEESLIGRVDYCSPKRSAYADACISNFEVVNTTIVNPGLRCDNCTLSISRTRMRYVSCYECPQVSVKDSKIWALKDWSYCEANCSGTNVDIVGSEVEILGLHFDNVSMSLRNSKLGRVSPGFGSDYLRLNIDNCSLTDLDIGLVWYADNESEVVIGNSVIGNMTMGLGIESPLRYTFHNSTVEDCFSFSWTGEGGIEILGGLRFGEDAYLGPYHRSGYKIKRRYDVCVVGDGQPMSDVELRLLRGNHTIWTGNTDSRGGSSFELTFVDVFELVRPYVPGGPSVVDERNVTDVLTLTVDGGAPVEVGLLTSTPIEVAVEVEEEKAQLNIVVAIAAFTLIMVAYAAYRRYG